MMSTGGIAGYHGYEYQFHVSALLAILAYVERPDEFTGISIETLFGQDAAIGISRPDSPEVTSLAIAQHFGLEDIQVQIKCRGRGNQWQPSDIREMLLKKSEVPGTEDPPLLIDLLAQTPSSFFVFVSDGVVSGQLSSLLIPELTTILSVHHHDKIEAARLALVKPSKVLRKKLTSHVLGRVAIIDALSSSDLKLRMESILIQRIGVPVSDVPAVIQQLVQWVRDAALRNGRDQINKGDLARLFGPVADLPYPDISSHFVETEHQHIALARLAEKHILVVTGEPASGKTTVAQAIANSLAKDHYTCREVTGAEAYREILAECQGTNNRLCILNDPFGYDEYNSQSGDVLGNQFRNLVRQIQQARGRIKLVITSRTSTLAQAIQRTQLADSVIREFHIPLTHAEQTLARQVFYSHLGDSLLRTLSETRRVIDGLMFENLLHASDCAYHLSRVPGEITGAELLRSFEASRPSLYDKWLNRQSTELLFVLYATLLVQEAEQISNRAAVHRIFDQLVTCSPLPPTLGLRTHFDIGIDGLLEQKRITIAGREGIDFHHPLLRTATREHFEQSLTDNRKVYCLVDGLMGVDEPLDQSIAAILALTFRERADIPPGLLATILQTRYVQVHDTFVRFGTDLLPLLSQPHADGLRSIAEQVYDRNYSPADCEIDARGRLIFQQREEPGFRTVAEIGEALKWEWSGASPLFETEPELPALLGVCLAHEDYSQLNPLQRHAFVSFVVDHEAETASDKIVALFRSLSVDPTSFVRQRVAQQLIRLIPSEISSTLLDVLTTLCFDSSPIVKIEALEKALLPIWANQSTSIQHELLGVVREMLSDPVVRRRVAHGLINRSGSLAHYHVERHSPDQIRIWFEAVAHKLLQFDFRGDQLDRYLSALEQHYSSIDLDYRLTLLRDLDNYASRNPSQTADLAYTINNIVLHSKPGAEENAILLPLIGKLPNLARAKLCYVFAREYDQLPDKRYAEFVLRPFYTEEVNDYIVERAAGLLGFLANGNAQVHELPPPVARLADDKSESIKTYLSNESEELRLAVVFAAFGYEKMYDVSAQHDGLHRHPVVRSLIVELLAASEDVQDRIVMANVILRAAPTLMGTEDRQHDEWLAYVDLILDVNDVDLLIAVCNIAFASNVGQGAHRRADWLRILVRFLQHPRAEVRDHAFGLFDEHYHSIFFQQVIPAIGSADRMLPGTVEWTDTDFVKSVIEHSPSLEIYLNARHLLGYYEANWADLSADQRSGVGDLLRSLVEISDYGLSSLVSNFLEIMGSELPDELVIELENSETIQVGKKRAASGHTEQFQKEQSLLDRLPDFDWSRLFETP